MLFRRCATPCLGRPPRMPFLTHLEITVIRLSSYQVIMSYVRACTYGNTAEARQKEATPRLSVMGATEEADELGADESELFRLRKTFNRSGLKVLVAAAPA
jgi:hypothetical protein